MGLLPTAILRAALLVAGLNPAPDVTPAEFRDWFDAAHQGRLEVPAEVAGRARQFRYVLVLGLMNERMRGYFDQNVKDLIDLGVPAGSIHRVAPSSDASFAENLGAIRAAFTAIADEGPEPLVIIGHSRGACDALGFALSEPRFVSRRVVAMFLIQGPFGGSGAADYLMGDGIPMDGRMPLPARILGNLIRNVEAKRLDQGRHAGILDLTSEAASRFWEEMLDQHASAIPIVSPRTFYIESSVAPTRHPLFRRPVARYLETYYGPNDGMVAAGDQSLPGIGTRLVMLDVGHNDLTHHFPAARADRRLRGAMTEAIFMAVAHRPTPAEAVEADRATVLSEPVPGDPGSTRQARR